MLRSGISNCEAVIPQVFSIFHSRIRNKFQILSMMNGIGLKFAA